MNSQEIVSYVMNTPSNTNPVILKQMIDENSGGATNGNDDNITWREVLCGDGRTHTLGTSATMPFDIDGAINQQSVVVSKYSAIGCINYLTDQICGNFVYNNTNLLPDFMGKLVSDYEAMRDGGLDWLTRHPLGLL